MRTNTLKQQMGGTVVKLQFPVPRTTFQRQCVQELRHLKKNYALSTLISLTSYDSK